MTICSARPSSWRLGSAHMPGLIRFLRRKPLSTIIREKHRRFAGSASSRRKASISRSGCLKSRGRRRRPSLRHGLFPMSSHRAIAHRSVVNGGGSGSNNETEACEAPGRPILSAARTSSRLTGTGKRRILVTSSARCRVLRLRAGKLSCGPLSQGLRSRTLGALVVAGLGIVCLFRPTARQRGGTLRSADRRPARRSGKDGLRGIDAGRPNR